MRMIKQGIPFSHAPNTAYEYSNYAFMILGRIVARVSGMPYATFGTDDLAQHVARGLKDRDACLMASHGQIAIGKTLSAALELALEVETLAEQYYKLLLLGASKVFPDILSDAAMAEMVARFKTYGQKGQG